MKPVTENLIEAIMLDMMPRQAAMCDFGITSQEHYAALHFCVRQGHVTPEALDAALGDGPALTRLITATTDQLPPNDMIPKGLVFVTPWDDMPEPE